MKKTCRWHVFSEERRDGSHTLACGSSSQQRFEETLVDSRHLHQGLHPRQFAITTSVVVANFFARVFTCGRIAVLRSKMGVFQTPKQFLPGVDRALARTTPALPAKSHAAPPLFACKRAHNALACYQLFAEKGKAAAFSQRLAVSVQNPGGRSPEGFSCPYELSSLPLG